MSSPAGAEPSGWKKHLTGWPAAAALVVLYGIMALASVRQKSPTVDELVHITGGYAAWTTGDYRLHPENGALPQRWAAIPLLFMDLKFPPLDQEAWQRSRVWDISDQFFYQSGNDAEAMLWGARAMIVLFGMALCAGVYAWSRALFGSVGGMISLLLAVFCPNLLAHGRLTTSDMALTLTLTFCVWWQWRLMHEASPWRVALGGVSLAALALAKMSGVLIVPMLLLLGIVRLVANRPLVWRGGRAPKEISGRAKTLGVYAAAVAAQALIVVALIWAAYGCRYQAMVEYEPGRDQLFYPWELLETRTGAPAAVIRVCKEHHLLPEAYLMGYLYVSLEYGGRHAFLNGQYSTTGWWYFFPYAFLIKTPLGALGAAALSWAALARMRRKSGDEEGEPAREIWYGLAPWIVLWCVYWITAMPMNTNIGLRHVLVTYVPFYIAAGAGVYWWRRVARVPAALLGVALTAHLAGSLWLHPHYLASFNSLVGGPRHGYRHLVDSSLDWGQDLPGLKRWLDEEGLEMDGAPPVNFAYFGVGDLRHYGIQARELIRPKDDYVKRGLAPWKGGVYVFSATTLQTCWLMPGFGAWSPFDEKRYQTAKYFVELYREALNDPEKAKVLPNRGDHGFWSKNFSWYDGLRTARMCKYLVRREPDAMIGYSILVFRLTAEEVHEALEGPPVELAPDPRDALIETGEGGA